MASIKLPDAGWQKNFNFQILLQSKFEGIFFYLVVRSTLLYIPIQIQWRIKCIF